MRLLDGVERVELFREIPASCAGGADEFESVTESRFSLKHATPRPLRFASPRIFRIEIRTRQTREAVSSIKTLLGSRRVTMNGGGREGRQADSDIFRSVRMRCAVANPLAGAGHNRLAGSHL